MTYAGEAVRRLELVADTGSVDGAAELLPSTEEALERGRAALAAYQEWYRGLRRLSSPADRGRPRPPTPALSGSSPVVPV